jgi:hypothetical protein
MYAQQIAPTMKPLPITSASTKNFVTATKSTTKPEPIRVMLHGFSNVNEANQIVALFSRANQWQQPWQVVKDISDAQFLIIAADTAEDVERWHGHEGRFTHEHLIAYSAQRFDEAFWHLRRHPGKLAPSPLEFTLLMKEIGHRLPILTNTEMGHASQAVIAKPKKRAFDWHERLKVLIVGSIGSGKTTAIETLTEGNAVTTEATPSDHTQLHKKTTTVAMDFGCFALDENTQLHIYGAPGQRRFNFMSEILIHKALGIIILINNNSSNALNDLGYYLDTHREFLHQNRAVIGVTHNDISPMPSVKEYTQFIKERGESWPVMKVDARKRDDMSKLVDTLLASTVEYG